MPESSRSETVGTDSAKDRLVPSGEYHKARKHLVLIAGLLTAWTLIGIDPGPAPPSADPAACGELLGFSLCVRNPDVAPVVLALLILFFAFRLFLEYQISMRGNIGLFVRLDMGLAYLIAFFALVTWSLNSLPNVNPGQMLQRVEPGAILLALAIALFIGTMQGSWWASSDTERWRDARMDILTIESELAAGESSADRPRKEKAIDRLAQAMARNSPRGGLSPRLSWLAPPAVLVVILALVGIAGGAGLGAWITLILAQFVALLAANVRLVSAQLEYEDAERHARWQLPWDRQKDLDQKVQAHTSQATGRQRNAS